MLLKVGYPEPNLSSLTAPSKITVFGRCIFIPKVKWTVLAHTQNVTFKVSPNNPWNKEKYPFCSTCIYCLHIKFRNTSCHMEKPILVLEMRMGLEGMTNHSWKFKLSFSYRNGWRQLKACLHCIFQDRRGPSCKLKSHCFYLHWAKMQFLTRVLISIIWNLVYPNKLAEFGGMPLLFEFS